MASETKIFVMETRWQTGLKIVTINWDCGAAAHADFSEAFPANVMRAINGLKCILAETIPGDHAKLAGTAPTNLYDIEILDGYDLDIFGTLLKDRSSTLSEQTSPDVDTNRIPRPVIGDLVFTLTNNSVDDANGRCLLIFEP